MHIYEVPVLTTFQRWPSAHTLSIHAWRSPTKRWNLWPRLPWPIGCGRNDIIWLPSADTKGPSSCFFLHWEPWAVTRPGSLLEREARRGWPHRRGLRCPTASPTQLPSESSHRRNPSKVRIEIYGYMGETAELVLGEARDGKSCYTAIDNETVPMCHIPSQGWKEQVPPSWHSRFSDGIYTEGKGPPYLFQNFNL